MDTNLGPLPTDFTFAPSCASDLTETYLVHTSYNDPDDYYLLLGHQAQTSCYPSSYIGQRDQYYSPGRCPTGYTAPCQSINRAGTVEETVLTCCPTTGIYSCQTTINWPWELTQGCKSQVTITSSGVIVSEVADGLTSRETVTLGRNDALHALSIQVRYQSTDFTSSAPASSTPTSSMVAETSSPTTTPQSSNNISGGAIAGIVVGSVAALLIIAGVGFFFVRRRNQRRQQTPGLLVYPEICGSEHRYHPTHQPQYFDPSKADVHLSHELDAQGDAAELDSGAAIPINENRGRS